MHNGILYFNCIGRGERVIKYELNTGTAKIYQNYHDDLLFQKYPKSGTIMPYALGADEKGIYSAMDTEFLYQWQTMLKNGTLSTQIKNLQALEKMNDDFNPFIMYYEYK